MRLFLDTNIFPEFDYKNADQSKMEILTPSEFIGKYINV